MLYLDSRARMAVGVAFARIRCIVVADITKLSFRDGQLALAGYSDDLGTSILLAEVVDEIADGCFKGTDELGSRRLFGTGSKAFRWTAFETSVVVGARCAQYLTDRAFGLSTVASSLLGAARLTCLCYS